MTSIFVVLSTLDFIAFEDLYSTRDMLQLRRTLPIVLSVGVGIVGYKYTKESFPIIIDNDLTADQSLPIRLYTRLPLNAMSRVWGKVNDFKLPLWAREPVIGLYIRVFGCNLSEAVVTDLKQYRNLGEFFRRPLKPGCRPVDETVSMVCPSDGTLLHCGRVSGCRVEQVKGVTYSLSRFLGAADWVQSTSANQTEPTVTDQQTVGSVSSGSVNDLNYDRRIKWHSKDTQLYHAVIYLAPGDYHRFHSPTEWTITFRRHFPGLLLTVNPHFARYIRSLFVLNERVAYIGQWKHGFMAMTAVGATNVGSIRVYHDRELKTNLSQKELCLKPQLDRFYHSSPDTTSADSGSSTTANLSQTVSFRRGDAFGEFNLGSTIVLVFEAPKSFEFAIKPGQKLKYGQILGR